MSDSAFSHYSISQLRRTKVLFKILQNPLVSWFSGFVPHIPILLRLPFVKSLIKHYIFSHFCGGEDWKEVHQSALKLQKQNILSSLDYSVECKQTEQDYETTKKVLLNVLEEAKNLSHIPFCVLKITGLGRFALLEKIHNGQTLSDNEKAEWQRVQSRFDSICEKAVDCNTKLLVDAEESWIQKPIDNIVKRAMKRHNQNEPMIYNTYQLYLKAKYEQLKTDWEKAKEKGYILGSKLVRGAYMEKETKRAVKMHLPNPIQPSKAKCDQDFNDSLKFCLKHIDDFGIYIGTHNIESTQKARQLMQEYGIAKSDERVFFSQLLGMREILSYELAQQDYLVSKYTPFGKIAEVIPYLLRRIQENSSVKDQLNDEIKVITRELENQKLHKSKAKEAQEYALA